MFTIYPAIDLRKGRVVRLSQGDPQRETGYSDQPGEVARRWLDGGARWLHVVNLDGAFDEPDAANRRALDDILAECARVGAAVQFGGGLRDLKTVEAALSAGVARVVLGTLAVEAPDRLEEALRRWGPAHIAAGLDARGGIVQVRGWMASAGLRAADAARRFSAAGLRTLVYTDIARDGLEKGPAIEESAALGHESGLEVIASGGVGTLEDVRAVRQAGLAGVIVGRALYEARFGIEELIAEETC